MNCKCFCMGRMLVSSSSTISSRENIFYSINMLPNVISNLYIKNNEIIPISQETITFSEFLKVRLTSHPLVALVQEYGMKLSLKLL